MVFSAHSFFLGNVGTSGGGADLSVLLFGTSLTLSLFGGGGSG